MVGDLNGENVVVAFFIAKQINLWPVLLMEYIKRI
jgi:hypothetical protein